MSDLYKRAKGGRLTFKGGELAALKSIDKKRKKKKKQQQKEEEEQQQQKETQEEGEAPQEVVYTIDAAKKMKYEELFPVETKKFGYDPSNHSSKTRTVEEALDDRVKKKADRYCK